MEQLNNQADAQGPDVPELMKGLADFDTMPLAPQPPDVVINMYPFQRQGLQWMLDRERNGAPRGGILADEMGLGKTVQTIALICAGKPSKEKIEFGVTQTLILAPLSCLQQWADEFERIAPSLRVLKYYGGARKKTVAALKSFDVLLATYGTVANTILDKDANVMQDEPLRKIHFYRIVLDEAHIIRNTSTRTHKACSRLRGWQKWCLTGTPVSNSAVDVGALLRFTGFEEASQDWAYFKRNVCQAVDSGNTGNWTLFYE